MTQLLDILGHPAVAGIAGALSLAAAVYLVDRGRIRPALALGGLAAALIAVVAVGAWRRPTPAVAVVAPSFAGGSGCGEAVVRRAKLSLRPEPSDSAPPMYTLRQGDRVDLACSGGDRAAPGVNWTRVHFGQWEGWVPEREVLQGVEQVYLERLPPSTLHSVR